MTLQIRSSTKAKDNKKEKKKGLKAKKVKKSKEQILSRRKNEVLVKKAKKQVVKSKKNKGIRRQYSPHDVQKALDAVKKGQSYREAAKKFGVPASSIHRAVRHPEKISSSHGPAPVLSKEVEEEILHWILYRAARGYPVTKTELLDSVQAYIRRLKIQTPFTDDRPGRHWYENFRHRHWYENFRHRHPEITLRTPQQLTLIRAQVSEDDLRGWFNEVKEYLVKNNLFNIHPSRVFNCDETNMQLIPKSEKILTEKGATTAYKVVDGCEKESITALFMYAADGTRAPPMIMYKYKESVPASVLKNCPVGWGIGNSETGWMTTETFYEYITNVFYPWLIREKVEFPIVLYLDGHSSHVTIPLVSFCREHKLEIIALYPNATHVMQPLDIAFFHPFKDLWKKGVLKWKAEENISRLRKEHIPSVLKKTLDSFSNEKQTIINGFRASGLVPFNPDAVEYNVLQKKKKKKTKNIEQEQNEQECQPQSNSQPESGMQHLMTFEQNLPDGLLQAFKEAEASGIWDADLENIGLFDYWLKIKRASSESTNAQLRIISDEVLNHKVIVIPHSAPESVNDGLVGDALNASDGTIVIEVDENIDVSQVEDLVRSSSTNEHISRLDTSFIDQNIVFDHLKSDEPDNLWNDAYQKENLPDNIEARTDTEKSNSAPKHAGDEFQPQSTTNDSNESQLNINEKNENSNSDHLALDSHIENVAIDVCMESSESQKINESPEKENTFKVLQESQVSNIVNVSNEEIKESNNSNDKENNKISTNSDEFKTSFADAFVLPEEYLPKNKQIKLRGSKKPRLPSVGTSDEWWKIHKEKEEAEKAKQEKLAQKKALQEEKKRLAEEKRLLDKKMKEIQEKIKTSQVKIKKEKKEKS